MFVADLLRYATAGAFTVTLLWAALDDAINRRIPNAAVLALLGLFCVWVALARAQNLVPALQAGAVTIIAGFVLWEFKVLGAGDAKLFATVALFVGWSDLAQYAITTALSGGVLAVIALALRPRRALVMWTLGGRGDFGRGIPYGVAIACGGVLTLWARLLNLQIQLPIG